MTIHSFGAHTINCWVEHPECALRAAVGYLTARIEHDRARTRMYRQALSINADPLDEGYELAVALARDLLRQNHKIDWKRADTA